MFTLDQVKAAQAKVRSGADFPRYIQELKTLGIASYDSRVGDGSIQYRSAGGELLERRGGGSTLMVAEKGNAAALKDSLHIHQQGGSDYPTFCREAAAAGVEKWTVDTERMNCIYYDKTGEALLEEAIPQS